MFKLNKKFKFFLVKILPISISVIILVYYCISENNLLNLIKIFPQLDFLYLIIAILLILSYLLLDSLVLSRLIKVYNNFFSYFRLTMVSHFYASITPFSSGGHPAQVLELNKIGMDAGRSISLLSKKVFIYQTCVILLSLFMISTHFNNFRHKMTGFDFFVFISFFMQFMPLILITLLYLNRDRILKLIKFLYNLLQKIKIIRDSEKYYKKTEKQLNFLMKNNFSINCGFEVYLFSFLQNLCFNLVPFFISKAFHLSGFPIFEMLAGQIFVLLISNFSPLPGATGLAENAFVVIFGNFFERKNILPAMILNRFITYYLIIVISFIHFGKIKKPKPV
ncbi:MAG: flippase-like domain-containing protein [Candidatus Improbicoccus pseudotrichonymphae]|uniref:Phosphatidylglycerol lysyltransferase n=1 Tax=Candidatus Improbicoccus pseudotrichonymphae TaxID=3033792 RepID=A0AA48I9V4_9FIRM|nr:MAG: flippase-like domain-containing protein [Candidatus Improbicoccus pseudotrichonymphae]